MQCTKSEEALMDLTLINTTGQIQLPSVLPESQTIQDSGYFSLLDQGLNLRGLLDSSEPLLPLLPHGLTSPSSQIYTDPILIAETTHPFRAESPILERLMASRDSPPSSNHHRTAYVRSLSDSSESDTGLQPTSELYIFESDTQDFILRSDAQIKPLGWSSPAEDKDDDHCVPLGDSAESVTHSQEWPTLDSESDMRGLKPPAEVNNVTPQGSRSVSPAELWSDACQYFAGEDPDKTDVLPSSFSHLSLEETQVSGYGFHDAIGWTRDWAPPVERWSSVESWASALSDWNVIVAAPAEELTAAFSEIGAEIDALTEALADINPCTDTEKADLDQSKMGLQDQAVEQTTQEESGQGCVTLQPQAENDAIRSVGDSTGNDQRETEDSSSRDDTTLTSLSKDVDLPDFAQFFEGGFDSHNEEIILKIVEDADVMEQPTPPELTNKELSGHGVFKVTEDHSVPRDQDADASGGSAEVDCNGLEASADPTSMNPCVSGVPGLEFNMLSDTLMDLDGVRQMVPQGGCPKFIVPVAPLEISSTLECRRSSLEGDQTKRTFNDTHPRAWSLWTVCDETTKGDDAARTSEEMTALCRKLSTATVISEKNRGASTLPDNSTETNSAKATNGQVNQKTGAKMPHKTVKTPSESKPRSKKSSVHHHNSSAPKKQENLPHLPTQMASKPKETGENQPVALAEEKTAITGSAVTEKPKAHGKKKKKHNHNTTAVKTAAEPLVEMENGAKAKSAKGRIEIFEAKLSGKPAKTHWEASDSVGKKHPDAFKHGERHPDPERHHTKNRPLNEDVIKKRRLSEDKFLRFLDTKPTKPGASIQAKTVEAVKVDVGAPRKKAHSEVVKHKTSTPKEGPNVVQTIQVASVSGDPQSLSLWCQFSAVSTDHVVSWKREGALLAEVKRSAGDESRACVTISKASHKDLGKYECCLSSSHGSITLDYVLTYEVLCEIIIPASPTTVSSASAGTGAEEEDAHCSRLMFKEDFLSEQYFGENHPVSIVTEKAHFGEGMHRRAFRTKLRRSQVPLLLSGHSCVLKVHNAVSYGTKNNEELVQRNFTLAVEECHVQNTAREYIKEYMAAAGSLEAFGEVPEIIPIYLVHRPSSDIPYATLEEELIGDFVKYSVKDGKEINLMRRDSEAGRKCCAFQHWVYQRTDGNLLVTDMQGVGMKLTDVGIATCKKGYKGFKGNCSTSFIDQFKVLHQCNSYCEILGLTSLQPKPAKKPSCAPKSKPQPPGGAKKKTFGPTLKAKS
ncbi:alpha-protein kinase 2 [Dunckerocampus dactyliophorus]|uniref:alpha-protein kinase 2 n=1 Tax=Dunckerocampus dactyliophorus TaxID=161453 RepID=UPI0024062454|nr:alpha-protein kinase 2 [Dunckerocampus dactyliophorus]XP_054612337.1 alpha-protein kinase 2 [Dunckerocampus dactyliophorus]XP_054612338.1 alpha-protein kinase 2 [Dunckerocampus dactyliophorus]